MSFPTTKCNIIFRVATFYSVKELHHVYKGTQLADAYKNNLFSTAYCNTKKSEISMSCGKSIIVILLLLLGHFLIEILP